MPTELEDVCIHALNQAPEGLKADSRLCIAARIFAPWQYPDPANRYHISIAHIDYISTNFTVATENLIPYSRTQPSLFKSVQLAPIKDLKLLVKDYAVREETLDLRPQRYIADSSI